MKRLFLALPVLAVIAACGPDSGAASDPSSPTAVRASVLASTEVRLAALEGKLEHVEQRIADGGGAAQDLLPLVARLDEERRAVDAALARLRSADEATLEAARIALDAALEDLELLVDELMQRLDS